jgi:hypothetical protein
VLRTGFPWVAKFRGPGTLVSSFSIEILNTLEGETTDKFFGDGGDALLGGLGKRDPMLGVGIAENDPDAGAVGLVAARTDGAGELREFKRQRRGMREIEIGVLRRVRLVGRMGEEVHEDAAGVIHEVAETLGDEDGVYIAGRGVLELVEVVIREGLFERNFDGGGGLIGVRGNVHGHVYSFTPRALFRVGAAGEDGEGAIELLGEHHAREFVGEGHGAKRNFLEGALAEIVREAVGVAAEEDEFAGAAVAEFAEPVGESVRIENFSGGVEKYCSGGAVGVEFLESRISIADFGDFDGT